MGQQESKPKMILTSIGNSPQIKRSVLSLHVILKASERLNEILKSKYEIDHIKTYNIDLFGYEGLYEYREKSKFRKEINNKFIEYMNDDNIWVIDISITSSLNKKYDCEIYYAHENSESIRLSSSLYIRLKNNNILSETNVLCMEHDIIKEADEYKYKKILSINFSQYLTNDRINHIINIISQWIKDEDARGAISDYEEILDSQ